MENVLGSVCYGKTLIGDSKTARSLEARTDKPLFADRPRQMMWFVRFCNVRFTKSKCWYRREDVLSRGQRRLGYGSGTEVWVFLIDTVGLCWFDGDSGFSLIANPFFWSIRCSLFLTDAGEWLKSTCAESFCDKFSKTLRSVGSIPLVS